MCMLVFCIMCVDQDPDPVKSASFCESKKAEGFFKFCNMCKLGVGSGTGIWISIKMESRIRIGINTVPIHNTALFLIKV
jgi:hypothetical protein